MFSREDRIGGISGFKPSVVFALPEMLSFTFCFTPLLDNKEIDRLPPRTATFMMTQSRKIWTIK